jgi:hypothetical protein
MELIDKATIMLPNNGGGLLMIKKNHLLIVLTQYRQEN